MNVISYKIKKHFEVSKNRLILRNRKKAKKFYPELTFAFIIADFAEKWFRRIRENIECDILINSDKDNPESAIVTIRLILPPNETLIPETTMEAIDDFINKRLSRLIEKLALSASYSDQKLGHSVVRKGETPRDKNLRIIHGEDEDEHIALKNILTCPLSHGRVYEVGKINISLPKSTCFTRANASNHSDELIFTGRVHLISKKLKAAVYSKENEHPFMFEARFRTKLCDIQTDSNKAKLRLTKTDVEALYRLVEIIEENVKSGQLGLDL
mgnify:CR=1 FL=1